MSFEGSIKYRQVSYDEVRNNLGSILKLIKHNSLNSTERKAYAKTAERYRHHFKFLFKEYVCDVLENLSKNDGRFLLAKEKSTKKIVAFTVFGKIQCSSISEQFRKNIVLFGLDTSSDVLEENEMLLDVYRSTERRLLQQVLYAKDNSVSAEINTGFDDFIKNTIGVSFVKLSDGKQAEENDTFAEFPIDSVLHQITGTTSVLRLCMPTKKIDDYEDEINHLLKIKENNFSELFSHFALKVALRSLPSLKALLNDIRKVWIESNSWRDPSKKTAFKDAEENFSMRLRHALKQPGKDNFTPVMETVLAGDVDLLKTLLSFGPDIEVKEPLYGGTIFHVAVHSGHLECLKLLLSKYPWLAKAPNQFNTTPLSYAQERAQADPKRFNDFVALLKRD